MIISILTVIFSGKVFNFITNLIMFILSMFSSSGVDSNNGSKDENIYNKSGKVGEDKEEESQGSYFNECIIDDEKYLKQLSSEYHKRNIKGKGLNIHILEIAPYILPKYLEDQYSEEEIAVKFKGCLRIGKDIKVEDIKLNKDGKRDGKTKSYGNLYHANMVSAPIIDMCPEANFTFHSVINLTDDYFKYTKPIPYYFKNTNSIFNITHIFEEIYQSSLRGVNKPDVINMSLGFDADYNNIELEISKIFDRYYDKFESIGVLLCISSGNEKYLVKDKEGNPIDSEKRFSPFYEDGVVDYHNGIDTMSTWPITVSSFTLNKMSSKQDPNSYTNYIKGLISQGKLNEDGFHYFDGNLNESNPDDGEYFITLSSHSVANKSNDCCALGKRYITYGPLHVSEEDNDYYIFNGTSLSTPIVTGCIGLIINYINESNMFPKINIKNGERKLSKAEMENERKRAIFAKTYFLQMCTERGVDNIKADETSNLRYLFPPYEGEKTIDVYLPFPNLLIEGVQDFKDSIYTEANRDRYLKKEEDEEEDEESKKEILYRRMKNEFESYILGYGLVSYILPIVTNDKNQLTITKDRPAFFYQFDPKDDVQEEVYFDEDTGKFLPEPL